MRYDVLMAKRGFNGLVLRALGARDHQATVVNSRLLAPRFLRITFESPTALDVIDTGPAAWVRLWIPDPDGRPIEYQRGYTISEYDAAARTFSIDFVLHEPAGPASTWASTATPGTHIALTQLGSAPFELPETLPAGYLLIGDAAAIPAINAIIEAIPEQVAIELYLEEHEPEDREIPLTQHRALNVHWVPRTDTQSLATAIEDRDWADWKAWATPESGSLKYVRRALRDTGDFAKPDQHLQAYWVLDRAMGKQREVAN